MHSLRFMQTLPPRSMRRWHRATAVRQAACQVVIAARRRAAAKVITFDRK